MVSFAFFCMFVIYFFYLYCLGRPNLLNKELLFKVKSIEKIESSEQFVGQEMLIFQKHISIFIEDGDIPIDLVVNLDQTLLSYV